MLNHKKDLKNIRGQTDKPSQLDQREKLNRKRSEKALERRKGRRQIETQSRPVQGQKALRTVPDKF